MDAPITDLRMDGMPVLQEQKPVMDWWLCSGVAAPINANRPPEFQVACLRLQEVNWMMQVRLLYDNYKRMHLSK